MKPSLDLKIFDSEFVSVPESQYIEYKRAISAGICRNVHDTICAYLNNSGGYIIMGIADSLEIVGIDIDEYDKFLTNAIDSIYHQKTIIDVDDNVVFHKLIDVKLHKTALDKYICIIDVTSNLPPIGESETFRCHYRLKTGMSFFRLNASNMYTNRCQRIYTQVEHDALKEIYTKGLIDEHEKRNQIHERRYRKLNIEYTNYQIESEKKIMDCERQIDFLSKERDLILTSCETVKREYDELCEENITLKEENECMRAQLELLMAENERLKKHL